MYPVAILAGGLATRLRPLTERVPKSLLEVNGEPFVAHQLRLLKQHGITNVVMCVGFLGEMIEEYVQDGRRFGVSVRYSYDGKEPLGTGGALRKALPMLPTPFLVLYGDSYLTCDYVAVQGAFDRSGKPGLMTVYANHGAYDHSNVEFSGGRIVVYDKKTATPRMQHIDYGLGIFSPEVLARYPEGQTLDLAGIYQDLLAAGELAAYEVTERFYEIGSFSGLQELGEYLARPHKAEGAACQLNP